MDQADEPPQALFRFFEAMPREGPGSDDLTRTLLETLRRDLPGIPEAADMGCGSGAASLILASAGAKVTAIDIWPPFLEKLERRAHDAGLSSRIRTRASSMLESGVTPASLDLVWAEGSIFTVGVESALEAFCALLKPRGFLVFSECTYLAESLPDEVRAYWEAEYPAMRTVAGNLAAALARGWQFREARLLEPRAWEESFYRPMEALMARMAHEAELAPVIASNRREIDLFRRHHDSFGYVFFVLRKP